MTTSLYIDEQTRKKAAERAKKDQLSMSAIMRILLSDYADGNIVIGARSVRIDEVSSIEVDARTQKKMDAIMKAWSKAKGKGK